MIPVGKELKLTKSLILESPILKLAVGLKNNTISSLNSFVFKQTENKSRISYNNMPYLEAQIRIRSRMNRIPTVCLQNYGLSKSK